MYYFGALNSTFSALLITAAFKTRFQNSSLKILRSTSRFKTFKCQYANIKATKLTAILYLNTDVNSIMNYDF